MISGGNVSMAKDSVSVSVSDILEEGNDVFLSSLPSSPEDLKRFVSLGIEKLKVLSSDVIVVSGIEKDKSARIKKLKELKSLAWVVILAEIKIKKHLSGFKSKNDYFKERVRLGISITENDHLNRLVKFENKIDGVISALIREKKVPVPRAVSNRLRNKTGANLHIGDCNIKYIRFIISCLQEYRGWFKKDIQKQHRVFKSIQILEKFLAGFPKIK